MLRFAGSRKVIEINSDLLKPFANEIAELVAAKSGKVVEIVPADYSINMDNSFTAQRLDGETVELTLDNLMITTID